MTDSNDLLPFLLLLQQEVEQLERLRRRPPHTRVNCPPLGVALWDERDVVDLSDLLTATLAAVARSRGLLAGVAGVALADDAIPFTFKGELVGVSEGAGQIQLVIRPQGRSKDNA